MPPSSALTRFLRQGLSRGVCPLCRVAYEVDGEYMWAFSDEYSSDQGTLDRLRRAGGFCAPSTPNGYDDWRWRACAPTPFQLTWERAADQSEQELVLNLQRRVVSQLVEGLRQNIRKQSHDYQGGPNEEESDSWQRAVFLTAGWAKRPFATSDRTARTSACCRSPPGCAATTVGTGKAIDERLRRQAASSERLVHARRRGPRGARLCLRRAMRLAQTAVHAADGLYPDVLETPGGHEWTRSN